MNIQVRYRQSYKLCASEQTVWLILLHRLHINPCNCKCFKSKIVKHHIHNPPVLWHRNHKSSVWQVPWGGPGSHRDTHHRGRPGHSRETWEHGYKAFTDFHVPLLTHKKRKVRDNTLTSDGFVWNVCTFLFLAVASPFAQQDLLTSCNYQHLNLHERGKKKAIALVWPLRSGEVLMLVLNALCSFLNNNNRMLQKRLQSLHLSCDIKCRWALTCFIDARLNVLKFCALGQDAEFCVAVFTIKLLCLSVDKVLKKKQNTGFYRSSELIEIHSSWVTFHSTDVLVH